MAQLHDACRKGVVGAEWKPPLHGATRGSGPALGCHESFPLLAHGLVLAAGRGVAQVVLVGVVGVGRFELPASCSQSRRANQAALHPVSALMGLWSLTRVRAQTRGPFQPAAQANGAHRHPGQRR